MHTNHCPCDVNFYVLVPIFHTIEYMHIGIYHAVLLGKFDAIIVELICL